MLIISKLLIILFLSSVLFTSSLTLVLADSNQTKKIKSKVDIVKPKIINPTSITPNLINKPPHTKLKSEVDIVKPKIAKSTPIKPTPIQPTPIKPKPITPTPVTPTPIQPTPIKPKPITPTPVTPTPIQPTPITPTPIKPMNLDLTGHWSGTFSFKDTTADACTFSGTWEATLRQNDTNLAGSISITGASSPDYPANDFCTLDPETFNFVGGTVFASSFQFKSEDNGGFQTKGYFTSNLIHR